MVKNAFVPSTAKLQVGHCSMMIAGSLMLLLSGACGGGWLAGVVSKSCGEVEAAGVWMVDACVVGASVVPMRVASSVAASSASGSL